MNRKEISLDDKSQIREISTYFLNSETKEERCITNPALREILSVASNDVIGYLAVMEKHGLSLKELRLRLKKAKFNNLTELFRLADWTLETVEARFVRTIRHHAAERAMAISKDAPQKEIVEIMRDFVATQVIGRTLFPDYVICEREDWAEILDRIRDFHLGTTNLSSMISRIKSIKQKEMKNVEG